MDEEVVEVEGNSEEATKLDEGLLTEVVEANASLAVEVEDSLGADTEPDETPAVVEHQKNDDVVDVSVCLSLHGTRRSIGFLRVKLWLRRHPRFNLPRSPLFRLTTL